MGIAENLPWQAKLLAKLILARLPVPYSFWRRMGLFRHGEMHDPAHAIQTFRSYFERAQENIPLNAGFTSLELGPGDSVLSGIAAHAFGAQHAWLIDAGNFATTEVALCQKTAAILREQGFPAADLSQALTLPQVLERCHISYLHAGTKSLAKIPDASVDFIWSQVVLEHVPKAEFVQLMRELRRVIKPGGIGVHSIDFRDHLSGGLNNLRFPERVWESHYFRNSGFYTNRLRPREMLDIIRNAGFVVKIHKQTPWSKMPIPRHALAHQFQSLRDEDFMVAEIEVLITPNINRY